MSSDDPNQPGLVITVTESIRSFLLSASNDRRLSEELRELALTLSSAANAPYKQIRSIWMESVFDTRPGLISLFSGSNFVFTSPKPREKSEELKERLRKLKELAERKEYQELVKDITPRRISMNLSLLIRIKLALNLLQIYMLLLQDSSS
ncbi:hypothetical protein E1A91_D08G192600v1 [Gossypium mustelinum]|uniref:Uncharacterized protein n=1 Tax=Gossypium mustelinum TaxID=34275 RepID=A0A5D2TXF5_GOSMU|nr:hypothetical protein E1A91_D08G192600v1 [Gossypium mustelinum]